MGDRRLVGVEIGPLCTAMEDQLTDHIREQLQRHGTEPGDSQVHAMAAVCLVIASEHEAMRAILAGEDGKTMASMLMRVRLAAQCDVVKIFREKFGIVDAPGGTA